MSIALHRRPKPFAPWAEVVPGAPFPMTVQDLLAWPGNDGYRYELVDGVLVRVAGSGDEATTIGTTIVGELYAFVRPRRMGIVTGADGVYKFPGAETGLVPDVGYYGAARRALIADRRKPIPFAPELAVEVASPDQRPDAMAAKARTYLAGGTQLVWIVWPNRQEVEVWHADLASEPVVLGARIFADPLD
jgi:Uma2 family endonuclease